MNIAFKEHSIFYWIFYSNVANSESKPTLDRAQRYEQTRAKAVMICLYVVTIVVIGPFQITSQA